MIGLIFSEVYALLRRKRIALILLTLPLIFLSVPQAQAKMKIAVLEFQNNATGGSAVDDAVRRGITDMLTTELVRTGAFSVYERSQLEGLAQEQRLAASGLVDAGTAVSLGRLVGVQCIITGAITEFTSTTSGGAIPLLGVGVGIATGQTKAKVSLDVRVIDVETAEVRTSIREAGLADHSMSGAYLGGVVLGQGESGGLLSAATYDCVQKISQRLMRDLSPVAYNVLAVASSSVTVDVGSANGVQQGQIFRVYIETNPVIGIDGSIIDVEKETVALLKAEEVQGRYSKCSVVKGKGGELRRGDKIEFFFGDVEKENLRSRSLEELSRIGTDSPPAAPYQPASAPQPTPSVNLESSSAPVAASAPAYSFPSGGTSNTSDQTDVVDGYPIDGATKNAILISHKGGYFSYSKNQFSQAYKAFVNAFEAYEGNYLDAYWAARAAHKLGRKKDATQWLDRALEINPAYEPALEYRAKYKL